ncbi:MAG: lysylphosphatidylglycerol synthase transmembrane domain-containing protein [Pseudomonadota bacterium]
MSGDPAVARLEGVGARLRGLKAAYGNARAIIGLAVSIGALVWVLRGVDLAQLWELTRGVDPLYFVALNLLLALNLAMRTWRWRLLVQPLMPCRLASLFSANLIGFAANNILPARLGEVVRAVVGARLTGLPLGASAASIVLERMLDGPVLLAFFSAVLLCLEPAAAAGPFDAGYFRAAILTFLAGYLAALAVLIAVARWPQAVVGPLARAAGLISPRLGVRVRQALLAFQEGLAVLRREHLLVRLLVLSVGLRLPLFVMHWLFLPAVGLPLDLMLAALATLGAGLASTLPSGPGYVGTYQLAVFWALRLGGAPEQEAWAYAILYWAGQYFPLVAVGLSEAWRRGLSLGRLSNPPAAPSPNPRR